MNNLAHVSRTTPSIESIDSKHTPHSSNNNAQTLSYMDRNPNINDRNLTGFCIVLGFFVGGLIASAVIASKIIIIGSFVLPASVFIWALTYPCSDIVAEVYGRKYANKLVLAGFIAYITMFIVILEAVHMIPAPFWGHQEAFETVLGSAPRVMIAAVITYLITQFFDVHLFGLLRQKTKGKHLWLRNNISTLCSQTLSNTIFLSIAFLGVFPMEQWIALFTANLLARYCLAFVDTSVVYAAVYALYKAYPELKQGHNTEA